MLNEIFKFIEVVFETAGHGMVDAQNILAILVAESFFCFGMCLIFRFVKEL